MNQRRQLPNWEQLYQEKDLESMPWFNPDLDPDLDQALTQLNLHINKLKKCPPSNTLDGRALTG